MKKLSETIGAYLKRGSERYVENDFLYKNVCCFEYVFENMCTAQQINRIHLSFEKSIAPHRGSLRELKAPNSN